MTRFFFVQSFIGVMSYRMTRFFFVQSFIGVMSYRMTRFFFVQSFIGVMSYRMTGIFLRSVVHRAYELPNDEIFSSFGSSSVL
ncbi:hypothetical protein P5G51_002940 [Virgibacillus sp. 179-BFC.A HS]|uniref:Uncharacterized protein n=1 Tax=Tigheibacillus jepli TaxID=3035914 RepID=A0ABU5CDW1_9BACI|nr:hypothetical protein [Virgibacillus sp. 179-BFC.A HS]MDY0404503.1 hypothetical protein [Virgibacillus sp. 179-BFC.A HS]